jgi:hypothetical protein
MSPVARLRGSFLRAQELLSVNSSHSVGQLFSLDDLSCRASLRAAQVLPFPDLDLCAHLGCAPVSFSAAAARLGVFSVQDFSSRRYLLLLDFHLGTGLDLSTLIRTPAQQPPPGAFILALVHADHFGGSAVVSIACHIFSLDLQQVLETGIVLEALDRKFEFS